MLDLNYVRENLEKVRAGLQTRGVAPEPSMTLPKPTLSAAALLPSQTNSTPSEIPPAAKSAL